MTTDMITDTTYPDARRKARGQLGGGVIALGIVGVGLLAGALGATSIHLHDQKLTLP